MFSQTPDSVLADVASLLEELDASENEIVFKKGDAGDSLYVILHGKVRVHDGEQLLNYLGESEVFGEMASLDPEPLCFPHCLSIYGGIFIKGREREQNGIKTRSKREKTSARMTRLRHF